MNNKLYIPKSLKSVFEKPTVKQFLLSLLATTISIALTFGTAAIIDNNKKQADKREIVMMVMYDMSNSLQEVQIADSLIRHSMEIQLQITEDTATFDKNRFQLIHSRPNINYTETVEKIFSSSIETINTVGDVLFVENVAQFFQLRKQYKETICDSIYYEIGKENIIYDMKNAISFDYSFYLLLSNELKLNMHRLFVQCQQMMKVTDEQLNAYRRNREKLGNKSSREEENRQQIFQEVMELQDKINSNNKLK